MMRGSQKMPAEEMADWENRIQFVNLRFLEIVMNTHQSTVRQVLGGVEDAVVERIKKLGSAQHDRIASCGHLLVGPRFLPRRVPKSSEITLVTEHASVRRPIELNREFLRLARDMAESPFGRMLLGVDHEMAEGIAELSATTITALSMVPAPVMGLRIGSVDQIEHLIDCGATQHAYSFLASLSKLVQPYERSPLRFN